MMSLRASAAALAAGAVLMCSGCYEMTWFYPAPGQGSLVTNGERLGVAKRLSGDAPDAQSFLVLSVREAYSADAGRGYRRTIVQVTANLVNSAAAPARLETGSFRLEVGGRSFAPKWVYRTGGGISTASGPSRDEVAPQTHARFDLFFDLEPYSIATITSVPPITGGIPLAALRDFTVSWSALWAGREVTGQVRFVRDYTGTVGGGWVVAPGPLWGWGWWGWAYPWPTGTVVIRPYYPWKVHPKSGGGPVLKAPAGD